MTTSDAARHGGGWAVILLTLSCAAASFECASSPRFTRDRSTAPASSTAPPSRPSSDARQTMEGIASYYGTDFDGKKTANGEMFDMNGLTAAHRSFPFGTRVKVTNLDNGRTVVVRVNDRGPFKLERIMDLSYGAAKQLDMVGSGTAHVRLEVIEWGPSDNN